MDLLGTELDQFTILCYLIQDGMWSQPFSQVVSYLNSSFHSPESNKLKVLVLIPKCNLVVYSKTPFLKFGPFPR